MTKRMSFGVALAALLVSTLWTLVMGSRPPPGYEQCARMLASGHWPSLENTMALSPLALATTWLPLCLRWAGASYETAFVGLALVSYALALFRAADALTAHPLAFWLGASVTGVCLLPTAAATPALFAAACVLLALEGWTHAPESSVGWVWLSVAVGLCVTPLWLLPLGMLWCRERGARWFDVLHGVCVALIGIAVPLMAAGIWAGRDAFVWWRALCSDGVSPSSAYAALGYLATGLHERFLVGRQFGQWVIAGDRAFALAKITPVFLCSLQGAIAYCVWHHSARAGDRKALPLAAACAAALTLSVARDPSATLVWATPLVLLWATQAEATISVTTLVAWSWACLARTQSASQEVVMAHGDAAAQLWHVVFVGCLLFALLDIAGFVASGPPPAPHAVRRTTWLLPKNKRKRR